jgi:hypothetical protein
MEKFGDWRVWVWMLWQGEAGEGVVVGVAGKEKAERERKPFPKERKHKRAHKKQIKQNKTNQK